MPDNAMMLLLECETRAEFEKLCTSLILLQKDLANTIMVAQSGLTDLRHKPIFRDFHPVVMTDGDMKALGQTKVGESSKAVKKMLAAITQQNRLAGHTFWLKGLPAWWIITFDLRDVDDHKNHWGEGPHVHMLSWLTHPKTPVATFVKTLAHDPKPRLPHPVHIRFEGDAGQDIRWGPPTATA